MEQFCSIFKSMFSFMKSFWPSKDILKVLWETSFYFIVVNIVGGLLPFWAGILIGKGFETEDTHITLLSLIKNGEIYIYSSGIFIATVFTVKEYNKNSVYMKILFWASIICLLAASLLYAALYVDIFLKINKFNISYLITTSKYLFGLCLVCSFLSQWHVEKLKVFDVTENNQNDFDDFKRKFQSQKGNN